MNICPGNRILALCPAVLVACVGEFGPVPAPTTEDVRVPPGWIAKTVDVRIPPAETQQPVPFPRPAPEDSQFRPVFSATEPPPRPLPAMSGGTLLVLHDGNRALASDPDRDLVWMADLAQGTAVSLALSPGDEPGRLAEDAAGRAHVVLRSGAAVISFTPGAASPPERRSVCPAPRGIAYEPATDRIHVACAGGELVSLPASGGPAVRTLQLDRDLRDVVVSGGSLYVTTFRSADLLALDGAGGIRARRKPAWSLNLTRRSSAGPGGPAGTRFEPAVAWRTIARPEGGVLMLHQRAFTGDVSVDPASSGGYGGGSCGGVVQTTVTPIDAEGMIHAAPEIPNAVLAVDVALRKDGRLAMVAAGDARIPIRGSLVMISPGTNDLLDDEQKNSSGCVNGGAFDPPAVTTWSEGVFDGMAYIARNRVPGQAVAVAFDGRGDVVVQTRQPSEIRVPGRDLRIPLGDDPYAPADVGHEVFHSNTGAGIACASCHPEGGDDGRVWSFASLGKRRTQSLRGRVSETLPLHWDGDMADLGQIMQDVFTGRMSGPELTPIQKAAVARWVDAIPLLPHSPPVDAGAVARGRARFASAGCATCHSGPRYTNGMTVDVGTGRAFQVPSLTGLSARAPFMHDGCAASVGDRFTPSCGGPGHGVVTGLTAETRLDLQAFLESL